MSNNSSSSSSSGGIGFCGLLALIFITLKLVGVAPVAAWSWLWVLSPLWIPFAIVLGIFLIIGVIALILKAFK